MSPRAFVFRLYTNFSLIIQLFTMPVPCIILDGGCVRQSSPCSIFHIKLATAIMWPSDHFATFAYLHLHWYLCHMILNFLRECLGQVGEYAPKEEGNWLLCLPANCLTPHPSTTIFVTTYPKVHVRIILSSPSINRWLIHQCNTYNYHDMLMR